VRAARWHVLLSALCLLAGGLGGFLLTVADESWFNALVPRAMAEGRGPGSTRDDLLSKEIFGPWLGWTKALTVMATFLFQNNATIGIVAFTLGVAGGVPTVLLIAYQGLMIGAFVALHSNRGLIIDFLGWLSIHGVTELAAIFLCGGAGLLLGEKVLFPGRYARLENLALHGREAARIAVGAVLMLFLAAILEGVFRQLVASTALRFGIGGATGLLWLAYFLGAGRAAKP
jgi:uncharacterized membrane protein SpoIIM required for sporulation